MATISTRQLPENYHLIWRLDLRRRVGLLVWLNLLGIGLLLLGSWLCLAWLHWLRPADLNMVLVVEGGASFWAFLALLLGVFASMLLVHEGIHGLFFWIFTGRPPHFGIGPGYVYACAPEWYIPKRQALAVMLAPAVLITLAGLLGLAVAPAGWLWGFTLLVSLNLSGAVADLYVAVRSARLAPECLYHDTGHVMEVYGLEQGNAVDQEGRDPKFPDPEQG